MGAHSCFESWLGLIVSSPLSLAPPPSHSPNPQIAAVKSKFIEAIQNYQRVEQQYQTRYKQRIERQFKIVKPDASPEEVRAVVNSDDGGERVFSQAVSYIAPFCFIFPALFVLRTNALCAVSIPIRACAFSFFFSCLSLSLSTNPLTLTSL
jgi:hypothetical protein